ncbi:copper chaperone CopZ [Marinilabilia salmonicolor]|jgi:copper chaperone CopZ|uniref:heavy-metal-associated domain-containing protein n=1 Tax=Marinilabilia salmonicolor TaxID=989 RepID=UPI000D077609|nr:cation transporter [Marinilabilia salmonicolor]PRY91895.1 copper chaperone CopZ [Marinilabilia salmonicolor]
MIHKIIVLLTLLLIGSGATIFAQNKTEKFEVKGECGMCEARIEKAANSVDGVTGSDWNKESEMITVTYDEAKTNIHHIHMAIAQTGHDTNMHKAPDEVYEKLPGCCKYDRAPEEKNQVVKYEVFGMDCPGCQSSLEKQVNKIEGVTRSTASFQKKQISVLLEPGASVSDEEIENRIRKANFTPGKKLNPHGNEE